MGKQHKTKADLNAKTDDDDNALSQNDTQAESQHEESDENEPVPKYDPVLEKKIDHQANMALLYLFFYSCLMFTLPFGSFFMARHFLSDHTDYQETTVTMLSVAASVVTVYIIIAAYVYHAYHEVDVVVPETKTNKKKIKNQ